MTTNGPSFATSAFVLFSVMRSSATSATFATGTRRVALPGRLLSSIATCVTVWLTGLTMTFVDFPQAPSVHSTFALIGMFTATSLLSPSAVQAT